MKRLLAISFTLIVILCAAIAQQQNIAPFTMPFSIYAFASLPTSGCPSYAFAFTSDTHALYYSVTPGSCVWVQVGGGGGSTTPTDSTTAGNGWWSPTSWASQLVTAGSIGAGQGLLMQVTLPYTLTFRYFTIIQSTGSGTCGGTCGYIFEIKNAAQNSVVCLSENGTSGNATARKNINQTAVPIALAPVSGSGVSGGVCTLPPAVYWIYWATDSTSLAFYVDGSGASQNLATAFPGPKFGYAGSMTTGSGATLAFTSGPFTPTAGAGQQIPFTLLLN